MIIRNVCERAEPDQPFYRLLMSDLHLGSACADHDAITRDLAVALKNNARVLINGDVFDAIGPKDKRFDLAVLHPLVQRKKDLAAAVVEMAKSLLWPYRKIIDVMGIGNHEGTWINYGYNDPVRRLIEELNRDGGQVNHGSFWGYINTRFLVTGTRKRPVHKLLYFHGTGGDSPVTKGTIDFNRKGRNWHYDALTFGHKHNLLCGVEQIADVTDTGKYRERRQLNLQTASYYTNYRQLEDQEALDYSYAAASAHTPKPKGGVFLCMRPGRDADTGEWSVRQDFGSDIIGPFTPRKAKETAEVT